MWPTAKAVACYLSGSKIHWKLVKNKAKSVPRADREVNIISTGWTYQNLAISPWDENCCSNLLWSRGTALDFARFTSADITWSLAHANNLAVFRRIEYIAEASSLFHSPKVFPIRKTLALVSTLQRFKRYWIFICISRQASHRSFGYSWFWWKGRIQPLCSNQLYFYKALYKTKYYGFGQILPAIKSTHFGTFYHGIC